MARSKKLEKMVVFLIPLGIAVNFIGGQIVSLLKLPIFLDSIGTVTVGALCGPVAGVIVGAVTNLLMTITMPASVLYITNNILVGLLSGVFGRMGFFRSFSKSLFIGALFGFMCGSLGTLVTIMFFGGLGTGTTGMITGFLMTFGIPIKLANFASELFADTLDKIPTLIIAFIVIKRIPDRFLLKLPLGGYYIKNNDTQSE